MFSFVNLENEIREYWQKVKPYEKVKDRNKGKKRFSYLDGPPFTNGAIHIGHAWGKALRDSIMRYKRSQGWDVLDRPGFDMHGLPIEVEVEKHLKVKNKQEIIDNVGISKFIETCKEFAIEKMKPMIEEFKFMGVWMDWDNPYMTIAPEYIESLWWFIKQAYEKGYLYEDKKVMTWCPRCQTALAKHELEYTTLKDNSIYVKFPLKEKKNEYLVIWTTTPWTLPFNLAVMVHPDFEYVKAKVGNEIWIVSKELADHLIKEIAQLDYSVVETLKGKELEGLAYVPPYWGWDKVKEQAKNEWAFRVILSKDYVDLENGSGLVHCAPGCGKEDSEVGQEYGLKPFNLVDEAGTFPEDSPFKGLKAKVDDPKFIKFIEEKGLLVATVPIEHEYATCWRCKTPIIFRATDQWFLKTSELKDKSLEENKDVTWVPQQAKNAFDSWLNGMQDWCISRQRFWGTPLPIWKSDSGKIKVIGSKKELEELAHCKLDDLHKSSVDNITFEYEGEIMHRVPDILDVWMDSGASSWVVSKYLYDKEEFNRSFPFDFILEGRDQIRGWFNSLMNMSVMAFGKSPYKAVYMHGMINDALGRKMSKSQHNYILPSEIFDKWGVDVFRYYAIGGTEPGLDLNYNFKDVEVKARNLLVLLNTSRYLVTLFNQLNAEKETSYSDSWIEEHFKDLSVESKYMISRVNSSLKEQTEYFENYQLNKTPKVVEDLYLDLSRQYIQLIREKVSLGSREEKEEIMKVIAYALKRIVVMLSPITPFISEKVYLNIKSILGLNEESVHLLMWPKVNNELIDNAIEKEFESAMQIIQTIQKIRDGIKRGIRWPIKEAIIDAKLPSEFLTIISNATNVKTVKIGRVEGLENYEVDGNVALSLDFTEELEKEGYARELMRAIQSERRNRKLKKEQKIKLCISSDFVKDYEDMIKTRTGAESVSWECSKGKEVKIKDKVFTFDFSVI